MNVIENKTALSFITFYDESAAEVFYFLGIVIRLHWSFLDPNKRWKNINISLLLTLS